MSSPKYFRIKRSRSAFTIIELLVAISITAVIATMMVTIVTNVLGAWSRSSATLSVGNQARFIFDQVALDLQGAIVKNSTDVTFAATIPRDQSGINGGQGDANYSNASWSGPNIKPGDSAAPNGSLLLSTPDRDLESYRFGQAGVWLRLFTVPADDNSSLSNRSAPRAVSYQIARCQVGSTTAPYTYQLFRCEARPYGTNAATNQKSTFAQGYDLFGANGYNGPDDLTNGGFSVADAGTIRRPRSEYVIGNGVIDFGVRIFTRNTTGVLEEAFPVDRRGGGLVPRRVFAATSDTTRIHPAGAPHVALASGNFGPAATSYGFPTVVEVMVRILTPEGLQILQSYEEDPARFGGAAVGKWWDLAEANSKVFVRRIEIKSTAL